MIQNIYIHDCGSHLGNFRTVLGVEGYSDDGGKMKKTCCGVIAKLSWYLPRRPVRGGGYKKASIRTAGVPARLCHMSPYPFKLTARRGMFRRVMMV
jgi:hypothetical protein